MNTAQELTERINSYLGSGGLFNPELMEHDKVRGLIMDCRDALAETLNKNTSGEYIKTLNASHQLRHEIKNVIRRYGEESDVTAYQAIGVLEIVKSDLIEALESARD